METLGIYALLAASLGLQLVTLQKTRRRKVVASAGSVVLDTCALIDGRVLDLAKAGFLAPQLFVPRPVIDELQYLADHGDAQKRSRARYGLNVVQDLQAVPLVTVEVPDASRRAGEEVDALLVRFAQETGSSLYTTDYNLNKVARIHGVSVLNVNELAHTLRPVRLPGEMMTVKIIQKGEANTQGVGYLEDGTMAVVDGAAKRIGEQVTVSVDRMIQTEAGKMVFASMQRNTGQSTKAPRKPQPQSQQTAGAAHPPQEKPAKPAPQRRPEQPQDRLLQAIAEQSNERQAPVAQPASGQQPGQKSQSRRHRGQQQRTKRQPQQQVTTTPSSSLNT